MADCRELKTCSKCGPQPVKKFSPHPGTKDGLKPACKSCSNEASRDWQNRNAEHIRNYRFQRKYGITYVGYLTMLETQNGVCAICKNPETAVYKGTLRSLSVDHNHTTGAVRGLLCSRCNIVIGRCEENTEILCSMIGYLNYYGL